MESSERVLDHSSGNLSAVVMFVGEAPGRLGADTSGIPFHGDKAGHNFETLIEQVGLTRYQSFITNAVLCNPKDEAGNNSTPIKEEVENCSAFLKRQIDLVQPGILVTLGATALKATSLIEKHDLTLSSSVRSSRRWYGRTLIPIYHPGQRAMVHRSYANQLADYQFIAEALRRGSSKRTAPSSVISTKALSVVDYITTLKQQVSYFSLHKLFFLIEVVAIQRLGGRITTSYIIRQKDGPYCVDLHIAKLKRSIPNLNIRAIGSKIILSKPSDSLFPNSARDNGLSGEEKEVIAYVVNRYGQLPEAELKRRAYLTIEMRRLLRLERSQKLNMFNAPLLQPSDPK